MSDGDDFVATADIARSYDLVAPDYLEAFGDELAAKPEDRRLLGLVGDRGGTVADIGSGPGHVSAHLRALGAATVAVDAAVGMAALAGADGPALVADMRRLPLADRSLDAVVAFYSLIHLPRPDVSVALVEFGRCVRPGGLLLAAVHAGRGTTGSTEFLGRAVRLRATLFGLDEMVAAVDTSGFEVVESFQRAAYGGEGTERIYVLARRRGASG